MTRYYLNPVFDSHKSFYKKAEVVEGNGKASLYSYGRLVAEVKDNKYYLYDISNSWDFDPFTATTRRHVKDFLYQQGIGVSNYWKDVYKNADGVKICGKWYTKQGKEEKKVA